MFQLPCASFCSLLIVHQMTPHLSTAISIVQRYYWFIQTVFMPVADLCLSLLDLTQQSIDSPKCAAIGWCCSHIVTDDMMHFMIHTLGLFLRGKIQMRVKLKEKPTYITGVLVLCVVGPLQAAKTDLMLHGIDWWWWRALSNTSPLGCQLALHLVIVKAKAYYLHHFKTMQDNNNNNAFVSTLMYSVFPFNLSPVCRSHLLIDSFLIMWHLIRKIRNTL